MDRKRPTQSQQHNEELRERCSDVLFYSDVIRMVGIVETFFDPLGIDDRVSLCAIAEVFFPLQRWIADKLESTREWVYVDKRTWCRPVRGVRFLECNWTPYEQYPYFAFNHERYTKYCEPMCMAAAANARFFATWMFKESDVQPWWHLATFVLPGFCFRNWIDLVQRVAPRDAPLHPACHARMEDWEFIQCLDERGSSCAAACCQAEHISWEEQLNLVKQTMIRFRFDVKWRTGALTTTVRFLRSPELLDWLRQEFGTPALARAIFARNGYNSCQRAINDVFFRRCIDVLSDYGRLYCTEKKTPKKIFVRYAHTAMTLTVLDLDLFRAVLDAVQWCVDDVFRFDDTFPVVLATASVECLREMAIRVNVDQRMAKRYIWNDIKCERNVNVPRFLQNPDPEAVGFVLSYYKVPRSAFDEDTVLYVINCPNYPLSSFRCVVKHYDLRNGEFSQSAQSAIRDVLMRDEEALTRV